MKLRYKVLIGLVLFVLLSGCFHSVSNDAETSESVSSSAVAAAVVEKVNYQIADKEVDTLERVTYRVKLDKRIITAQNLKDVAEDIVKTDAKGQRYTTMFFFFYGPSDYVMSSYMLGTLKYAPYGEMGNHLKARSDYSNFEFFDGEAIIYSTENLPSEKEFEICGAVDRGYAELNWDYDKESEMGYSEYSDYREETVKSTVASKYGITTEEVHETYMDVLTARYDLAKKQTFN
ncbi:hypothetical protein [Methanococcus maripaludis]|uniref:Lipoprotein n=1 Tax=Methanococcus maripaludis TaxID=39152 RepID=A0A8T4CK39_METMI|nr:hypothetical protein [Methanococcus maripaludis]MBM7408727.1 hypothetical protein [Methanococcus maripaludis]MBP2220351.1 hypothetical protein [Methanococcus maripaludis]